MNEKEFIQRFLTKGGKKQYAVPQFQKLAEKMFGNQAVSDVMGEQGIREKSWTDVVTPRNLAIMAGIPLAGIGISGLLGGGGFSSVVGSGTGKKAWDWIKGSDGNFGLDDALKIGTGIFGVKGALDANKDSQRSRQMIEEMVRKQRAAEGIARQEYELNAPLREAFRAGAMNFVDPTNPFGRNVASFVNK